MKLTLVVLKANDLQQSVAFYEALGLCFLAEQHGNGPKHFSSDLGGSILEIYPADREVDGSAIRLGLSVKVSLDQLVERLENNGTKVITPPKDSPWGRRTVVVDLNGYRIELSEEAT